MTESSSKAARNQAYGRRKVLLVTGMSGAGKTSALKALEDLGYETIDNLPLSLLESLVFPPQRSLETDRLGRPIAIGIDIRTRDFGSEAFSQELDDLRAVEEIEAQVVFIDCDNDELRRRYAETRHRHPLAMDRPVEDGIVHERRLMAPIRDGADVVLDTGGQTLGDLKRLLDGHFGLEDRPGLSVFVTSFSYRRGVPREADLVFDVRFLANPYYDSNLRPLTGQDPRIGDFVSEDPGFAGFFDNLCRLLAPLLPRYAEEGKSYLTIAVGCTGGRHRSVFVAEKLAAWLGNQGLKINLYHRELDGSQKP